MFKKPVIVNDEKYKMHNRAKSKLTTNLGTVPFVYLEINNKTIASIPTTMNASNTNRELIAVMIKNKIKTRIAISTLLIIPLFLKHKTAIKMLKATNEALSFTLIWNPKELFLNYKLYNVLKNSECFDIGFYLNNNIDLQEGKWFEYLPLELHYVCNGFNEKRSFNKKFYNKKTKKELLEYLLKYNH